MAFPGAEAAGGTDFGKVWSKGGSGHPAGKLY